MKVRRAFILTALLLAVHPGLPGVQARRPTLAAWADGPARYLLPPEESRRFEALETEGARALFIERFWLQRDPTAGTLRNEYREEFWARVEEANLRFAVTGPGWKSDRGRILILLGWPDRVESESFPRVDSRPRVRSVDGLPITDAGEGSGFRVDSGLASGHRGVERWHYRNTDASTLGPNLIVAFYRDASDEYRLASDSALYSPRFPSGGTEGGFRSPVRMTGAPVMGAGGLASPLAAVKGIDLPTISSLPALVQFELIDAADQATPRELAAELVTAEDFLDMLPVRSRHLFFRGGGGRTAVMSGLSVPGPALYGSAPPSSLISYLLAYLSFAPEGTSGGETTLADNENAPRRVTAGEAAGRIETWTGAFVAPGRYRVALGLLDAATGRVASMREDLEVPDFSGRGPLISSLLLAGHLPEELHRRPPVRAEIVYDSAETFALYYELYGLAASYAVSYRFEYRDTEGWRVLAQPVEPGPRRPGRQGWQFPLTAFPAGTYRLTVIARGSGDEEERRSVVFEVLRAPEPSDGEPESAG